MIIVYLTKLHECYPLCCSTHICYWVFFSSLKREFPIRSYGVLCFHDKRTLTAVVRAGRSSLKRRSWDEHGQNTDICLYETADDNFRIVPTWSALTARTRKLQAQ